MWESNRYNEYPGIVQGKGKRAKKRPWGMSRVNLGIKRGVHDGDKEGQTDKRDRKRLRGERHFRSQRRRVQC